MPVSAQDSIQHRSGILAFTPTERAREPTMRIDKVVIACYVRDFPLARSCVASIRYWYPDIEIYLLKDERKGKFSTREIEKHFNVKILKTPGKYYGWGTAKYEALFTELDRFLLLDADTVFLGQVLDELSQFDNDFIVTGIATGIEAGVDKEPEWLVARDYIDVDKMMKIDPEYKYPGYGINTGQLVITTGKITAQHLDEFLVFPQGKLKPVYDDILKYTDQGLINYILAKLSQEGSATVRYHGFWLWPDLPKAKELSLGSIKNRTSPPLILHWAGIKSIDRRNYSRYDILCFFEDLYYTGIPLGSIKKYVRHSIDILIVGIKVIKHKIFREAYM
jgi:hypothetical protein